LTSLERIYDYDEGNLRHHVKAQKVFNWTNNPWSLGGYSYSMPETADSRKLLDTSLKDTIFFCGEGFYTGDAPATVEAAIIHAKQTAKKIKKAGRA
jgi:monoamine oxidase